MGIKEQSFLFAYYKDVCKVLIGAKYWPGKNVYLNLGSKFNQEQLTIQATYVVKINYLPQNLIGGTEILYD